MPEITDRASYRAALSAARADRTAMAGLATAALRDGWLGAGHWEEIVRVYTSLRLTETAIVAYERSLDTGFVSRPPRKDIV